MKYMLELFGGLIPVDANSVGIPEIKGDGATFNIIVGLVYMLIGALALLYIVRGALLFLQANGDPGMIKEARNTVLYAVIGLGLTTIVFTILNFVAGRLS